MQPPDGYTDLEPIGHGGLGDVYRARRTSTGSAVAIKVLRDLADASVAWTRTRRELTALVSLGGHANVVQLIEVLEDTPGLVMEYAPGGSVAQLLERRGTTLSVAETVLIGRHTASALNAAHARGIVHRDVKPQNLLVDAYGQVKLCDFGIASLLRTEEFRARTSAISMRYASPEDLDDDADVGPPADVYSLGATLLHLTHGAPPTLKERLAPWTAPATDDADLAALDRILAACLRPSPAARPTAAEVLDRLDELDRALPNRCRAIDVHAEQPVVELRPAPPAGDPPPSIDARADDETELRTGRRRPEPPRPAPRRPRTWLPVLLAVGGLLVAAAAAFALWPNDETTTSTSTPASTDTPDDTPDDTADDTADDTPDDAVGSVSIVDRPDGLVPLDDPDLTWPFGPVGECLRQVPGDRVLQPVDCTEPHDLERFSVGEVVTEVDADGYDADAVNASIDTACATASPQVDDELVGEVRIAQTRPSSESWEDGDRAYQCLLGVPGRRLVGSVAD